MTSRKKRSNEKEEWTQREREEKEKNSHGPEGFPSIGIYNELTGRYDIRNFIRY